MGRIKGRSGKGRKVPPKGVAPCHLCGEPVARIDHKMECETCRSMPIEQLRAAYQERLKKGA